MTDNQNKEGTPESTGKRKIDPWAKKTLACTMVAAAGVFGTLFYVKDRGDKSTENKDQICAEVAEELTGESKIDKKTCDKIAETVNFIKNRERERKMADRWKDKKSKSIAEGLGVDDYKKVQRVIQQKMNKKPNQRTVKGMQMKIK